MVVDRHLVEGTIEFRVKAMSVGERIARVRELREKAEREYLQRYREMMAANGSSVIDGEGVHLNGADGGDDDADVKIENDNGRHDDADDHERGTGLGVLHANGADRDARPRERDGILGPIDREAYSQWRNGRR
jgi:hypothetical protein